MALTRPMVAVAVDGHDEHVLGEDEALDLLLGRPTLHLRRGKQCRWQEGMGRE